MQAAQNATQYFMGQGMVFIGLKEATTGEPKGLRHVGNCTDLKISNKTDTLELKESMTGTRGLAKRMTTGVGADFSAMLESLDKDNLAIALRGTATAKSAGTVTGEAVTAFKGTVCKLKYAGISAVTVKGSSGTPTYVAGTDYVVNDDSITIPSTGAIAALDTGSGAALKVDYSYKAQDIIDAFAEGEKEYWVRFEGLNTADENRSVIVDIYKVAVDALKELAMIGDKQAEIELSGSCLLDSTRATGSKYYTVTKVS